VTMHTNPLSSLAAPAGGAEGETVALARRRANRTPVSDAHLELGSALKQARTAANVSTRGIPGVASGHISRYAFTSLTRCSGRA
jgi:hypothetical protein